MVTLGQRIRFVILRFNVPEFIHMNSLYLHLLFVLQCLYFHPKMFQLFATSFRVNDELLMTVHRYGCPRSVPMSSQW